MALDMEPVVFIAFEPKGISVQQINMGRVAVIYNNVVIFVVPFGDRYVELQLNSWIAMKDIRPIIGVVNGDETLVTSWEIELSIRPQGSQAPRFEVNAYGWDASLLNIECSKMLHEGFVAPMTTS